VALGRVFFGESMFSTERDASKVALAWLCARLLQQGTVMIDCQMASAHLMSLGARLLPRADFLERVRRDASFPDRTGHWTAG